MTAHTKAAPETPGNATLKPPDSVLTKPHLFTKLVYFFASSTRRHDVQEVPDSILCTHRPVKLHCPLAERSAKGRAEARRTQDAYSAQLLLRRQNADGAAAQLRWC